MADNITKIYICLGILQIRIYIQDIFFLFLDRFYTGIETADTITSFFVCCCIYFVFFGKSVNLKNTTATETDNTNISQEIDREKKIEKKLSILFVEKNGLSVFYKSRQ